MVKAILIMWFIFQFLMQPPIDEKQQVNEVQWQSANNIPNGLGYYNNAGNAQSNYNNPSGYKPEAASYGSGPGYQFPVPGPAYNTVEFQQQVSLLFEITIVFLKF